MAHIISLTVEDSKWEEFKNHFLITHPNQTLEGDNPLSDEDWIKYKIFLFTRGAYEKGFSQLFAEQNPPPYNGAIISQSRRT